jgi:hypothetical protein
MLEAVPSAAVVAAGNVPPFILADIDMAEMLAALAPYTTPAHFQALLLSLASRPDGLDWLKHKHRCLRVMFLTSLASWPARRGDMETGRN